ncbi:tyrosine-type recombinase/integrase [Nitrosococcus watsonii]|uniref:tyrosine-type recombinase/integrase n=1 Tax=Nitrosococcus watsonii TaxID=473531 RepID=UPI0003046160|nr:tyrosine-type recombinase/integrase [Nitrosococcus watsonii]
MLQRGIDILTIQVLLGHSDLETTMIYTHVLNQGRQGVISPLDNLGIGWLGRGFLHNNWVRANLSLPSALACQNSNIFQ